jgi:pullulanase-type alpha-1,6-glucosidase
MRKLMVDSVLVWATDYKVDGFRFDLMGHHMVADMVEVRAALDSLTLENDGVDGSSIYVYGEGWNFGEVQDNARGVNATQLNIGGTGIGVFNDRLRDAVRGGSPFGGYTEQGFATGLFTDPNGTDQGSEDGQRERVLLFGDQIRVGMAGNLRDYTFMDANGEMVTGADVDYNGSPAGYTLDPQENIVYISAHDNETWFDAVQYKMPADASVAERVRADNVGVSIVMLSQGVPFFHAGIDMLRSKAFDRDSFNSGDWFNQLDFSYESNGWGIGLPVAGKNQDNWPIMQPLLADENIAPQQADILNAVNHFQEMLAIRRSSPLFRLETAEDVQGRVVFHNTGPDQLPGVIVMTIADGGELADLDNNYDMIVVVVNATPDELHYQAGALAGMPLELHPVQQSSLDPVVQGSSFDSSTSTLIVPGRTTAVFVLNQ